MSMLAVITDEISEDLREALDVCKTLGIRDVELRVINGSSIVDKTDDEVAEVKSILADGGFRVVNIASPFLKTHIGDEESAIGNVHAAKSIPREQHWDVLKRSLEIAHELDSPMVRAFSFWRVADPESVREDILETLGKATEIVKDAGKILGLENEHACNIGDGFETAWYLDRITDPTLQVIWDPGNIAALGKEPTREQYEAVADRIGHVHIKDAKSIPATEFVTPGEGVCDWESQFRWLHDGGYDGPVSLETHFTQGGPVTEGTRVITDAVRNLANRGGMPLN